MRLLFAVRFSNDLTWLLLGAFSLNRLVVQGTITSSLGALTMKMRWVLCWLFSSAAMSADCFDMAGQSYSIDPDLLRAISFRESSFNPRALNVVSETKYAVGLMQIHSQNFAHLAQFGITPEGLYNSPCLNIHTGAYYLAHAISRLGYNWDAVGAYYAGFATSPEQAAKRTWYAQRVKITYDSIKAKKATR